MKEYLESLEENGYYLFTNVIPPALLESLRLQIDSAMHVDLLRGHTLGNYSYILQNKGSAFIELLENSPLQDSVDAVLGNTCILHSYNSVTLAPRTKNVIQNRVYRDSPRFCHLYLLAIQILYMIDDFTLAIGQPMYTREVT
jgi:hypothetical protein